MMVFRNAIAVLVDGSFWSACLLSSLPASDGFDGGGPLGGGPVGGGPVGGGPVGGGPGGGARWWAGWFMGAGDSAWDGCFFQGVSSQVFFPQAGVVGPLLEVLISVLGVF